MCHPGELDEVEKSLQTDDAVDEVEVTELAEACLLRRQIRRESWREMMAEASDPNDFSSLDQRDARDINGRSNCASANANVDGRSDIRQGADPTAGSNDQFVSTTTLPNGSKAEKKNNGKRKLEEEENQLKPQRGTKLPKIEGKQNT